MQHEYRLIDLSKALDSSLPNYKQGRYADPSFECAEWCSVASQGYRVSALRLGTQTGTHIDAPAHFDESGATLDALPVEQLVGRYFLMDLPREAGQELLAPLIQGYSGQHILFLRTPSPGISRMPAEALDSLLQLPPMLWILSGEVAIEAAPDLEFHRALARAGKFLVEDLDQEAAARVGKDGEIAALPLRLIGTSGAPCRVIVKEYRCSRAQ